MIDPLKLKGNGVIPTIIFGSESMDVTNIRTDESLMLSGLMVRMRGQGSLCQIHDYDRDGFDDLNC